MVVKNADESHGRITLNSHKYILFFAFSAFFEGFHHGKF